MRGKGVRCDAARPGDVEADGFALKIHQRSTALPGLQHRVMLDGQGKTFRALTRLASHAVHSIRAIEPAPSALRHHLYRSVKLLLFPLHPQFYQLSFAKI